MKFLKFKKINYTRSPLVTAKFSISHNSSVVDYTEATVEWDQWAGDDCDSDTGVDRKLQVICRLCNKLLMIMLNY